MRPGVGVPLEAGSGQRACQYAVCWFQRDVVLVFHIVWRMIPSLPAAAMHASLNQAAFASLRPRL